MAVVVQCYHCNTILELDEGFRGGVCRCSTCGSLLQVPKAATPGAPRARPAAPGAAPTEIQRPATPNADSGLSRGQFDSRNNSAGSSVRPAVPDFGGSSSGLRPSRPASPVATAEQRVKTPKNASETAAHPNPHVNEVRRNNALLYVGIALAGMILIVVVILVVMAMNSSDTSVKAPRGVQGSAGSVGGQGGGGGAGGTGGAGQGGEARNSAIAGGPGDVTPPPQAANGFLGIPLTGKKVLLSVDGASSMADYFDYVRMAAERAADKLGPDQEMLIVVWKDDQLKAMPASGFVGKAGTASMRDQLEQVAVSGSSNAAACMKASLSQGADQIIFVTAKDQLDPQIATELLGAARGVRFDAAKIGDDDDSTLQTLAAQSKGTYQTISPGRLGQAAQ